jgi:hypothetical protein
MEKRENIMDKYKTPLPEEFASIEEVQAFWDSHSTADYWSDMEDVDMQLSPTLQAKLETKKLYRLLGLSAQQASIIEQEARREQTDARHLITHWVLEHIPNMPLASGR